MKDKLIVGVAEYGVLLPLLVVLMYVVSLADMRDKAYVLLVTGSSVALAVTTAKVLKRIFKTRRPQVSTEMFTPFDEYAFPSGLAYTKVCEQHGLNPLSQPFTFLRLNGKEVMYAGRGATPDAAVAAFWTFYDTHTAAQAAKDAAP
jgi:hypothetical protein